MNPTMGGAGQLGEQLSRGPFMSNAESRTFAWKRVDGFRVEIREGEQSVAFSLASDDAPCNFQSRRSWDTGGHGVEHDGGPVTVVMVMVDGGW